MIPNAVGTVNGGNGLKAKSQSVNLELPTAIQEGGISLAEEVENEPVDQALVQQTSSHSFVEVQEQVVRSDRPKKGRSTSDSMRDSTQSLGVTASVNACVSLFVPANQHIENSAPQVTSRAGSFQGVSMQGGQMLEGVGAIPGWDSSPNAFLVNESTKGAPNKGPIHLNEAETATSKARPSQNSAIPTEVLQSKQSVAPLGAQEGTIESVDGQKLPGTNQETKLVEVQDSGPPPPTENLPGSDQKSDLEHSSKQILTNEHGDLGGFSSGGDDVTSNNQNILETQGETGGGMPDAQWQMPMKKTVEMDQMTRHSQQEMPSESFSAVNKESWRKNLAEVSEMAHSNGALQTNAPVFDLSPRPMSHVEPSGENAAAPTSTWERVVDVAQAQAVQMHRINATTVDAVIKPDDQTELHLRMHWNGTQMEAQLRCEQGQKEILQQHWDQLRDSLAAKGIVLTAWQPQLSVAGGSLADDRRKHHRPSMDSSIKNDGATIRVSNTSKKLNPVDAVAFQRLRQWETWA